MQAVTGCNTNEDAVNEEADVHEAVIWTGAQWP